MQELEKPHKKVALVTEMAAKAKQTEPTSKLSAMAMEVAESRHWVETKKDKNAYKGQTLGELMSDAFPMDTSKIEKDDNIVPRTRNVRLKHVFEEDFLNCNKLFLFFVIQCPAPHPRIRQGRQNRKDDK